MHKKIIAELTIQNKNTATMLYQIFLFSVLSFVVAIIACVYILVLAHEDILNWWFRFGSLFEKYWFHKPIWGCEKCFAGQLALWTYLIINFKLHFSHFKPVFTDCGYNVLIHVYFVCMSIFLTRIITQFIQKHSI